MSKRMDTEALSIAWLEDHGWVAGKVETKVTRTQSRDLFGFADVAAYGHKDQRLLLQCTTTHNLPDRLKKVLAAERLIDLLERGVVVEVWGWYPDAKRFRRRGVSLKNNRPKVTEWPVVTLTD